jgi:hypothetical protein
MSGWGDRRSRTEDPEHLNERRAAMGLPAVDEDPLEKEPTPEARAEYEEWLEGYEKWLYSSGWRKRPFTSIGICL